MKLISNRKHRTYHNHRAEPYFTFIKNGEKTIEGRVRKGWYSLVAPSDHIVIFNEEESDNIEVIVKNVRTYVFFKEMLENEQLKKVLPNVKSTEEGVKIYEKFYSPEEERRFGVVAIEVEKISN